MNAERILITVTLCLAFLGWGTIFVARTVIDRNYHAPVPKSALEQRVKALGDCSATSARSQDCAELLKASK